MKIMSTFLRRQNVEVALSILRPGLKTPVTNYLRINFKQCFQATSLTAPCNAYRDYFEGTPHFIANKCCEIPFNKLVLVHLDINPRTEVKYYSGETCYLSLFYTSTSGNKTTTESLMRPPAFVLNARQI